MVFRIGILFPLIITFIIVVLQRAWRDRSLMDLTSLIYFSTASIFAFLLYLEFFIQYYGFAGYLAVFLRHLFL